MHTVEQAKELWCPMVRAAREETNGAQSENFVVGGCNTDALGRVRVPASCRCIADKCAMWRWGEDHPMRRIIPAEAFNQSVHKADNFYFHPADELEGEPDRYIETTEAADSRRRGYCGLAHRPNY